MPAVEPTSTSAPSPSSWRRNARAVRKLAVRFASRVARQRSSGSSQTGTSSDGQTPATAAQTSSRPAWANIRSTSFSRVRSAPAAGALAYALGVKNMATLNVEFYTGIDERLDEPLILPPVPDLSLLRTERLLVVDDVADTGRTLALARDFCAQHVPEVRTAVLYEKPQSVVRCDFVWRRTDRWINFPWSTPTPAAAT